MRNTSTSDTLSIGTTLNRSWKALVIIAVLATVLVACDGSETAPPGITEQTEVPSPQASETPAESKEPKMVEVLAPIDRVEILVAESFPPQYFVEVESGLRNGCEEFDRYEVERKGETITVTVTNLEPAAKDIACTEEYRTVMSNVPMGSDFEPGRTYTVLVNDVTETFVTQGSAPGPGPVSAALGSPFQLKVDQTALIEPQGPMVDFMEVVEDSRCPTGAACVWAGRARILIRVSSVGDVLGFGIQDLTLEAGQVDLAKDSVEVVYDTYLFELLALDPYPQATEGDAQPEQPDYTATLVVSKVEAAPAPGATATSTAACTVRTDWFEYTVVRGDTLFSIAQRSGSSVEELAEGNCLGDPTKISVGQRLYAPNPIATNSPRPTDFVQFYLIIPEDNGQSGPAVGCGDSAVAVWRDRTVTGSLPNDIQASLEELFAIETEAYGKSGFTHSLYDADLTVQSVTVSGDTAVINLTGTLQLVGVCADARMEAQILLTVFQYPGFDSALITIDGRNMKQLFDASGTVGDDEPYRRSEVEF